MKSKKIELFCTKAFKHKPIMDDKELFQLRQKWYSSPFVLFQIVQALKGREGSFLNGKTPLPLLEKKATPVRGIKAHNSNFLLKNFDAFNFYEKPYNIYFSLATFEGMPMMSFAPKERQEQSKEFFNNGGFSLCWTSYDFVLDLDNNDLNIAYEDAKKTKKVLDDYGLAYSLKFSGSRGFHFLISDKNIFPQSIKLADKVILAERLATNLRELENIKSIDLVIYQPQRILKVPYSLEGYNVALPLSDDQFDNFKVEDMRIDKVFANVKIMNRGILERPKKKDSLEFIKMYGIN